MATARERLEELRALDTAEQVVVEPVADQPVIDQTTQRARLEELRKIDAEQEADEGGFMSSVKDFFTGEDRQTRATEELPELGRGGLLSGEDATTTAKIAPVLLSTTKPEEIAQILTTNFPSIGITQDEKGNLIAGNNKTGVQVIINKPGVSGLDLLQGLGIAASFTPAGKAASLGKTVAQKALIGAAGAGVTESAIQAGQELSGGEFTPSDVVISSGFGGAGELIIPAAKAVKSSLQPLKEAASDTLTEALSRGSVLTTDVFPPNTFIGKAFQKVSERIPLLGTGKVRAAQQQTRRESIENIAVEFNIDPSSEFEKKIVNSANQVFKGAQSKAARFRKESIVELNKRGDFTPANAIDEINNQINRIKNLGAQGDDALIQTLNNIKGELAGNFERLKNIRTTIFDDISDIGNLKSPIKSGGDAVLSKVAGALSKDLDNFAVNAGQSEGATSALKSAASKWKASNRIFKDNFAKAKETELKKALTKGKVQPEIVNSTIRGGKKSELVRMHRNLDLKGRKSVRQQILKNALEKTGFPERINPTVFLNELNRPNNKKAINIFFKGNDLRSLNGYKKFIDITRRAQEEAASIATQQELTTVGLIGGTAADPVTTITAATVIGLGARVFESAPIRNLLIKLSNPKLPSKQLQSIVDKLKPLIIASAREEN